MIKRTESIEVSWQSENFTAIYNESYISVTKRGTSQTIVFSLESGESPKELLELLQVVCEEMEQ